MPREANRDWIVSVIGSAHTHPGEQRHCHGVFIILNRLDEIIVGEDLRGKGVPGLHNRSVPELGIGS